MLKLRPLPALVAILACGLAHAATPTKAAEFVGTDEPFASQSGMRQFGYSVKVPGMFWVRRSPTASVKATPISTAGVSAR